MTQDLVPVVSAHPTVAVGELVLPIALLTLDRLRTVTRDERGRSHGRAAVAADGRAQ